MDSRKKCVTTATLRAPPPRIRPGAEGDPTPGRSRPVPVDFAPLSWSAQAIATAERISIAEAKPQAGRTRPKRQRLIATEGDSRQHDSDGDSTTARQRWRQRQGDRRQRWRQPQGDSATWRQHDSRQHDSTTAMATAARRQRDRRQHDQASGSRATRRGQAGDPKATARPPGALGAAGRGPNRLA